MNSRAIPVYDINHFQFIGNEADFYANTFKAHIEQHSELIMKPHRHSFFLCVFFTKGSGTHFIDFNSYEIKPGQVFTISPGQVHNWEFSKNTDGYIFFHTREFFNIHYTFEKIEHFPFFLIDNEPVISLENHISSHAKIKAFYDEITEEYAQEGQLYRPHKLYKLANLVYIELVRIYLPKKLLSQQNHTYLAKVRQFEDLIEQHFKEGKLSNEYAAMMNISEKHLNRMSKEILNKTTSQLILQRIILEAKRMLGHSTYSVNEVAVELGYTDSSYFFRVFKKETGQTPSEFMKKLRQDISK